MAESEAAGSGAANRDTSEDEGRDNRDALSQKVVVKAAHTTAAIGEQGSLAFHLRRAGGTALGGLPPIPAEHRAPMGTRTTLAPLKLILFSGHPSLPSPYSSNPPFQREELSFRF